MGDSTVGFGRADVAVGSSVVHRRITHPAGEVTEWNARWHRKRRHDRVRFERDVSWWVGWLFTVGSVLFVVGGVIAFWGDRIASWLNLVGSVAFSIGAILTVIEADRSTSTTRGQPGRWTRLVSSVAGRAALVQLVSALVFFQLAMVLGVTAHFGWVLADVWIWTPSALGSAGFVVASRLFWLEARPAHDIGTLSTVSNLGGSVLFVVGSLFGYAAQGPVVLDLNDGANPAFLAGSVAFTLGSVLSLIELNTPLPTHAVAST